MTRRIWVTISISLFIVCLFNILISSCSNPASPGANAESNLEISQQYVGEKQCQSCHPREHSDWEKSDHFLAMQVPNDSTVLGDFNNTMYTADGVTNKFSKKDGKYYINTEGEDGKNHDYEVRYTFGYFPLQQYLLSFPGGRMQSARVSWDSRAKKWFHQYPGQKIYHKDWLHWTGNSQTWNTMCASCHSTNLQKNYDFEKDRYNTTWTDLNVSCESCHGPGSGHIEFINSKEYNKGSRIKNSGFLYAHDSISQLQVNTCAPCHARKSEISQQMIHSAEILDDLIPQVISNDHYFADGQIKEEDYEYGSFTQSKMFHNNVRCSNCHNPHSGKLKITGNELCTSCHNQRFNSKEHHFHAINSEGSQCINCHMPAKTFMGNDHRRDHSFRIPRPDQSVSFGTPNACSGCHTGKTPKWAAESIAKWYGPTRKYHFSDDLVPGSKLTEGSENHLMKLLGDTSQPEIARATAAYYLGNIQTQPSADALSRAVQDKKALVRFHALRSLESFNPDVWRQVAYQSLSDNVRAVRIAAAGLYRRVPLESIPPNLRNVFLSADAENRKYLTYQTDFAVGNIMLADYELQGGEHLNAIKHYLRGLEKDSLMNYARINLSAAFNSVGRNQEALKTLKEAVAIDPANDHLYYNLGLLYYELGDTPSALVNFKKAVALGSRNNGLYYNYGIALQRQGKRKEAEQILLKGYKIDPLAKNLNYALAYFYLQQNLLQKALIYAQVLRQLDPQNPEYQSMFKSLGL